MNYAHYQESSAFHFSFAGKAQKLGKKFARVYRYNGVAFLSVIPPAVPVGKTSDKSFAVIGAGAIGCIFAEAAGALGHATTLCVRHAQRKIAVQRQGVVHPLNVTLMDSPEGLGPVDWVVIATKAQDTLSVAPWLSRLVGRDTKLLLLQNGIDGVHLARRLVKDNSVLPSVVYINAERHHPGLIMHHFGNHIEVPACEAAEELKPLMAGGIDVRPQNDFTTASWRKLIINIAVNPITALTAQRFGVFAMPEIRGLAGDLIREAARVGNACGADLPDGDVEELVGFCANLKPQGGTSMLFDRLNGNALEFEHLTGTIVRLAQKHDMAVPLNTAILALLTAVSTHAASMQSGSAAMAAPAASANSDQDCCLAR